MVSLCSIQIDKNRRSPDSLSCVHNDKGPVRIELRGKLILTLGVYAMPSFVPIWPQSAATLSSSMKQLMSIVPPSWMVRPSGNSGEVTGSAGWLKIGFFQRPVIHQQQFDIDYGDGDDESFVALLRRTSIHRAPYKRSTGLTLRRLQRQSLPD